MLQGIDFAYGNGLTTAQIRAAGKAFVGRYLSTPGNPKNLGPAELENYYRDSLAVVVIFETTGVDMTSYQQGLRDADAAQQQLSTLAGQTGLRDVAAAPVFFAADAPVEVDETDYLRGAHAVVGLGRTGLYGGLQSIRRAFDLGLIRYGFQAAAWSGGQWDNRALLRQVAESRIGPAWVDLDQAAYWSAPLPILDSGDDYGQYPKPPARDPGA